MNEEACLSGYLLIIIIIKYATWRFSLWSELSGTGSGLFSNNKSKAMTNFRQTNKQRKKYNLTA